MKLDGIGLPAIETLDRGEGRSHNGRDSGERFHIGRAAGPDGPSDDGQHRLFAERAGSGRRRPMTRLGRRAGELHSANERAHDEVRGADSESRFSIDPDRDGEGGGDRQSAEDHAAAAADFEAFTQHLLRIGGPIREVTLYLPSLGQVTARMEAGAISIVANVPRRLVDAVRRGEKDLREQMGKQGLRVAHIQINPSDEAKEEPPAAPARQSWPSRGLVDVMA